MAAGDRGADLDLLERQCLGQGLPPEAERHLHLAGQDYRDAAAAEAHLRRAQALAPQHAAVYIGLYRFYFYQGRLEEALAVSRQCLDKAGGDAGLNPDWRAVRPGDADFDSYEAVLPRFYLFSLKAYGYLQMRLGRLEAGREAIAKLMELDPADKLGGGVLLEVLARMGREDDD